MVIQRLKGLVVPGLVASLYLVLSIKILGTSCLFERVAGFPCPGCGMLTSLVSLLYGNIPLAMAANPMAFLWLATALYWLFSRTRKWMTAFLLVSGALTWAFYIARILI